MKGVICRFFDRSLSPLWSSEETIWIILLDYLCTDLLCPPSLGTEIQLRSIQLRDDTLFAISILLSEPDWGFLLEDGPPFPDIGVSYGPSIARLLILHCMLI